MEGVEDEGQMGREKRRRKRDRRQVEAVEEVVEEEVEVEEAALLEELGKSGERGKRENPRMFSLIVKPAVLSLKCFREIFGK